MAGTNGMQAPRFELEEAIASAFSTMLTEGVSSGGFVAHESGSWCSAADSE